MDEVAKNPVVAALGVVVEGLKKDKAPTSMGYNDFTLIFALAQEQLPEIPITAEYISKYLNKHPGIPKDARLDTQGVQPYLTYLEGRNLLRAGGKGYVMHDEVARILSANVHKVKTLEFDEFAIRGVVLYAALDSPLYR